MTGGEVGTVPPRPNYWDYLHIEELLSLQGGLEGDDAAISNHEILFIVVHLD